MSDMFVRHHKQLLFLVGVPRSGTTWLQKMLAAHPDIATAQESHIFNHFIAPMTARWQSTLDFKDGRGGIGLPAYYTQPAFYDSLCDYVFNCFNACPLFQQHPLFLEKTPDHLIHVELIHRVIPSARFIYVRRNAYDVIESLLAAGRTWGSAWAPRNIVNAIRLFNHYRTEGERQLATLPNDRWMTVQYEALRQTPDKELAHVMDFLKLAAPPTRIETMLKAEQVLCRYGEFATIHGHQVDEPADFHRKMKARLSLLQKSLIYFAVKDKCLA